MMPGENVDKTHNNAYAITTTLRKSKRDYVPAGLVLPAASRISPHKISAGALRKAANNDRRNLKQSPPAVRIQNI
jgi:hypothetical protein